MCKVMMIAGIKKQHQDKVKKLSAEFLKAAAESDDDGFGYAAITKTGQIYGEKWLKKEDVFKIHSQPIPEAPKEPEGNAIVKDLLGVAAKQLVEAQPVSNEKIYDDFGVTRTKEVLQSTVAVILHARKKTVGLKSIENCHPFYAKEDKNDPATALIHNGSILNHLSLTKKTSSCDSEVILHEYLNNAMYCNPWAMPKLAETLVGQYTVGVLTSNYTDGDTVVPVLDIFKSAKELHCVYVKEIETMVFSTIPGLLMKSVHNAGLTPLGLSEIRDGYLIRLNAITGEKLEDIIPFPQSRQWTHGQTSTGTSNGGMGPHHRPAGTHSRTAGMSMIDPNRDYIRKNGQISRPGNQDETVEDAKRYFEEQHRGLFTAPYYDTGTGLTKEEMEYFQSLEINKEVDKRALQLVKKVLNF